MASSAVVIPTFNEENSIDNLLHTLAKNSRISHIIVVDDTSTDRTKQKILEHAKRDGRVQLIERRGPRSFAASYRDGFLAAIALGVEQIIQMDADGSHPADSLDEILNSLENYDIVIGSRFICGGETIGRNVVRRTISKLGNNFVQSVLKTNISDMTGGFNGWRSNALRKLLEMEFPYQGFVIQIWLKQQALQNHTWIEIPIHFAERQHDKSKFNLIIFLEGAIGTLRMRFNQPDDRKRQ